MERNSWNIRMNDRNLTDNDKNKAKNSSWGYGNNIHHYHHGDDLLDGFSWPPRSYTCSFCKREFRSAQALGGHMNVHRRDRARLRQSPPWDTQSSSHLDLNPNPNFSSFISTTTVVSAPFTYKVPSLISPSLSCLSSTPSSSKDGNFSNTFNAFKGFTQKDECKKGGMVMLDLEIGLRSSNTNDEELDLELRLGYS